MRDDSQPDHLRIRLNERAESVPVGTSVWELRARHRPDTDVVIYNGFPITEDVELRDGDEVVLIRRGERPSEEEMESLMVARHGPGIHARVKRAHVGIAGCGGLGSAVAVALARTGVGHLTLVDFDVVEPSNLNRQQFFVDQIGALKTEALRENLARINPYVRVDAVTRRLDETNVVETFAGCDVVAECFDAPTAKRMLAVSLRRRRPELPLVTVSGIAGVGPSDGIGIRRVLQGAYLVGDTRTAASPGCGLLAPRVGVAAGHQANLVLRLILDLDPLEEGAA